MSYSVFIRIIQGRNLLPCDWNGKSDPYCFVSIDNSTDNKPRKTSVKHETLDPVWDETFSFPLKTPEAYSATIHVWDHDVIGSDDRMGFVKIPLKGLEAGVEKVDWYQLSTKGEIKVAITLVGFGTQELPDDDIIPEKKISKKKLKLIQDLFNRCDINKDGKISKEELAEQLKNPEVISLLAQEGIPVVRAFDTLDIDGDGEITYEEMETVMTHHSINVSLWAHGSIEEVIKLWANPKYLEPEQSPLSYEQLQNLGVVKEAVILDYKRFLLDMAVDIRTQERHQIFDEKTTELLKEFNIDPSKINGNSRSWWGLPEQGLFTTSKKVINTISNSFKYQPNQHQSKVACHTLIGFLVRMNYEIRLDDNVGCIKLNTEPPILLFRSGTMVNCYDKGSCLRNLIKHANLKHIINLYAGHYPLHDVYEKEKLLIESVGGTYHNENFVLPPRLYKEIVDTEEDYKKNYDIAAQVVTNIIKEVLLPHGNKPKGNILIHCGGGMHRTGIIFGTIRRCFNNDPIELIDKDYWFHTGEEKDRNIKGGGSPLNVRFIQDFPSNLVSDLEHVKPSKKQEQDTVFDQWGYVKGTPAIQFPELYLNQK